MTKEKYKEIRIRGLGKKYRRHTSSKSEWDKIIAMECGELPYNSIKYSIDLCIQMLLKCKFTANEIDAECKKRFPKKMNTGRAKRTFNIFSENRCKNVEKYRNGEIIGLKWDKENLYSL